MKQVYKITYPNGKIYFGVDVTGIISYFGSPSDSARIEADLGTARTDFSIRKTILWGSNAASGREARAMETNPRGSNRLNLNIVALPCKYKIGNPVDGAPKACKITTLQAFGALWFYDKEPTRNIKEVSSFAYQTNSERMRLESDTVNYG